MENFYLQIDDDVIRHNELLHVIQNAPSEMSEIVSRRRKDFTKEFFVHLHTVAESYYDDPAKQDGKMLFSPFLLFNVAKILLVFISVNHFIVYLTSEINLLA